MDEFEAWAGSVLQDVHVPTEIVAAGRTRSRTDRSVGDRLARAPSAGPDGGGHPVRLLIRRTTLGLLAAFAARAAVDIVEVRHRAPLTAWLVEVDAALGPLRRARNAPASKGGSGRSTGSRPAWVPINLNAGPGSKGAWAISTPVVCGGAREPRG